MARSQIPALDATSGTIITTIPDAAVVLASQLAPRQPLMLEVYRHAAFEMPELLLPRHHLTIQLSASLQIERRVAGRFRLLDMHPGAVGFTPAASTIQARWSDHVDILALSLDPQFVAHAAHDLVNPDRVALVERHNVRDEQIQYLGLALRAEVERNPDTSSLYVESLAGALALHLLRRYSAAPLSLAVETGGLSPTEMRRVLAYIHDRLAHDLSLAAMAAVVHLSPSRFAALFKRATGQSPYHYVLQQRLERARQLLLGTQMPIAAVARATGFAHQSHLTRQMRRALGMTPRALRASRA